jgi:hypothetical protein
LYIVSYLIIILVVLHLYSECRESVGVLFVYHRQQQVLLIWLSLSLLR